MISDNCGKGMVVTIIIGGYDHHIHHLAMYLCRLVLKLQLNMIATYKHRPIAIAGTDPGGGWGG